MFTGCALCRSALTGLKISIALLIVDSIIELAFISRMVGWLNQTASQSDWRVVVDDKTYSLSGLPKNLILDQGHTSNGAAGTALVVVGLGGLLALKLRRTSARRSGRDVPFHFGDWLYYAWLLLSIPALLLTTVALGYVFAVTDSRAGQRIDVSEVVSRNSTSPYPLLYWTPQNWFSAVLRLDLVRRRSEIQGQLAVMKGWQYNLIVMFLAQLAQTVLAFIEHFDWRRGRTLTVPNADQV